jgi:hypothetical protein
MPIPERGTFFSYTNATPINGNVLVPSYAAKMAEIQKTLQTECGKQFSLGIEIFRQTEKLTEADCAAFRYRLKTFRKAEQEAQTIYGKRFKNVHMVESSDTIKIGGAVHCTTKLIPAAGNGVCKPPVTGNNPQQDQN